MSIVKTHSVSQLQPATRFPSLDGLRAVAITLVIAQHLSSGHTVRLLDYLWRFQLGDLGVRLFFVVSGFLITTLLLKEYETRGSINLGAFYRRRILRIFPAYYCFLAVISIAAVLGFQTFDWSTLLAPIFYVSNYIPTTRIFAHTWSLAVEEQFYLIWPGLICFLGFARAGWIAVLLLFVSPILRAVISSGYMPLPTLWYSFQTAGDALAMGCVFALVRTHSRTRKFAVILARPTLLPVYASALLWLATSHQWPWFWNVVGISVANILIVLIVETVLCFPRSFGISVLNTRPLIWVGMLSYSLYLWQQVFVYGEFRLNFPFNLILIICLACASYYLVERPFLRLKNRSNVSPGKAGSFNL